MYYAIPIETRATQTAARRHDTQSPFHQLQAQQHCKRHHLERHQRHQQQKQMTSTRSGRPWSSTTKNKKNKQQATRGPRFTRIRSSTAMRPGCKQSRQDIQYSLRKWPERGGRCPSPTLAAAPPSCPKYKLHNICPPQTHNTGTLQNSSCWHGPIPNASHFSNIQPSNRKRVARQLPTTKTRRTRYDRTRTRAHVNGMRTTSARDSYKAACWPRLLSFDFDAPVQFTPPVDSETALSYPGFVCWILSSVPEERRSRSPCHDSTVDGRLLGGVVEVSPSTRSEVGRVRRVRISRTPAPPWRPVLAPCSSRRGCA